MTTLLLTRRNVLAATSVAIALASIPTGLIRSAQATPKIGAAAPGFTAVDSSGVSHSLADYQGQTVVLEWTNHMCPYVGKHYGTGNMQALQHDAVSEGIVWFSIISAAPGMPGHIEGDEANRLNQERNAAPSTVLMDPNGELGRRYDARTTPHMYVIDSSGMLVYMGGIDDRPSTNRDDVEGATNYVRAALDDLANGRSVATPMARPYGCAVKYGPAA